MNPRINDVIMWHYDRNLIDGSTDKDQYMKLIQECGELSDSICKGRDVSDDIGDILVVLINIAERNGLMLSQCLERAWNDIKDRKGRMVDGVFIKEEEMNYAEIYPEEYIAKQIVRYGCYFGDNNIDYTMSDLITFIAEDDEAYDKLGELVVDALVNPERLKELKEFLWSKAEEYARSILEYEKEQK